MRIPAVVQMTLTQATMIRRNVSFWLISIFIAVLSMAVFGYLFQPDARALDLAVVQQEATPASQALASAFGQLPNVSISALGLESETERFNDGKLAALVVIPEGFEAQMKTSHAPLRVFFDSSDPVRASYVQSTVSAVVDNFNKSSAGVTGAVIEPQSEDTGRGRFIDFLTPGMVGMTILWTNLAVGHLLISWREQGILRRLGVTPLRPATLIGSQAISFAFISLVQSTVILGMGHFLFGVDIKGSYLYLLITVALGVLAILSMGYVIASLLRTVTSATAVGQLIAIPMMFLGKSYFPLDAPAFLAPVVAAVPLTYINDALRQIVNHGNGLPDLWLDWVVLGAWTLVGFALSFRLFRWQ